jgi:DNA replication licensing factor MCM2
VAQRRRIPAAMMQDTEESMLSEGNEMTAEMRKRRERHFQDLGDDEDQEDAMEDEKFLDLEEMRGKLNLWIRDPRTIRYIRRTFKNFLLKYRDEQSKSLVYEGRINDMCSANQQSLEITYIHLTQMNPTLAYWIFETPALI